MNELSTTPDDQDENDRQFVTALARGLDVLGCFRAGDRYLSNHEISRRTELARPTVSRLTHTLMKTGHLQRDEASGEYRLGAKVLQLGFSTLAATDISERCAEHLAALGQGPNPYIMVALAERAGTRAVYLAAHRSRQVVSLAFNVGMRMPLFYSAIGRAILAGTPEKQRQDILRMGIAEFPGQKDRMEQSLREAVRDYETYGYCTSFGGWKPEINAIAAPVRSLDGTSIYGINIGGPSFLVPPEELHEHYGHRLLAAVDELGKP